MSNTIFHFMRNKEIKAVLFDMDGTLFDSEVGSINMMKEEVFKKHGIKSEVSFQELTGLHYKDKLNKILGFEDKELYEKIMKIAADVYAEIAEPIKGVNECLISLSLSGNDLKLAVCTNGYMEILKPVFDKLPIRLDLYLGAGDDYKRKPEPDLYIEALKHFDIKPEETLVAEDSLIGVSAALAAGIPEENILIFDPTNLHEDSDTKFTCWQEFSIDERAEPR